MILARCKRVKAEFHEMFRGLIPHDDRLPIDVDSLSFDILVFLKQHKQIKSIKYFNSGHRFYVDIYTKNTRLRLSLWEWDS